MLQLKTDEKMKVQEVIKRGTSAREISRAHVLNLRSKNYTIIEVADILDLTPRTVINVTNNYKEGGIEKALKDDPRPGQPPKFDDRIKSKVVAIVCSEPPEGFDRWTLELLTEKVVEEQIVDEISKESMRLILQEHDLKPWQYKMWCIPKLDKEFVERMEDILDVYERGYDPSHPVVCVDEKPVPLTADKRQPIPHSPGSVQKIDYEYCRNGSVNVFCTVEPLKGVYMNRVTSSRTGYEFAKIIGSIGRKYSEAEKITLVLDNLSTHYEQSLIKFYGEKEGSRIWNRFEVHYTPKHGSWLNQAEIAIGMYDRQCLGESRIGDIETLRKKTKAWNKIINKKKVEIKWKFTKKKAREKFGYQ